MHFDLLHIFSLGAASPASTARGCTTAPPSPPSTRSATTATTCTRSPRCTRSAAPTASPPPSSAAASTRSCCRRRRACTTPWRRSSPEGLRDRGPPRREGTGRSEQDMCMYQAEEDLHSYYKNIEMDNELSMHGRQIIKSFSYQPTQDPHYSPPIRVHVIPPTS